MSALQLAVVLAPTALQLLWLRRLGATRGRTRQAARMVALGAASAAVAGAVGTLAQGLLGLVLAEGTAAWHAAHCVLYVALTEELCKLLAARRVSERCSMDVGACCVLVAIGFDLAENLSYSITTTMAVTVVRALKSVAGHTLVCVGGRHKTTKRGACHEVRGHDAGDGREGEEVLDRRGAAGVRGGERHRAHRRAAGGHLGRGDGTVATCARRIRPG